MHIPKTGGNWVNNVLWRTGVAQLDFGHKHLDLKGVQHFDKYLNDANKWTEQPYKSFKFCFVRNPITWYESWWHMMMALDWPNWGVDGDIDNWHPNSILNGLGSSNFNYFIENVLNKCPGYVSELYSWYTSKETDFIGKQENLIDDLSCVFKLLGMSVNKMELEKIQPLNVSRSKNKIVWDPDLLSEVKKLEVVSFKRFGYLD